MNRAERFWSYVDRSGGPDACWPWLKARDPQGYGRFHTGKGWNATQLAHRVAYGLTHGELPPVVRHRCDNPPCCNPAHHLPGTRLENNRDMVERGRHCSQTGNRVLPRGTAHHTAKLDSAMATEMRERYARGDITQRALGAKFRVCQRTVNKVVRGLSWT